MLETLQAFLVILIIGGITTIASSNLILNFSEPFTMILLGTMLTGFASFKLRRKNK